MNSDSVPASSPTPDNACRLCGSEKSSFFAKAKGYDLMKCARCAFIWVDGVTGEDIEGFYEEAYFDGRLASFSSSTIDLPMPPEKIWIMERWLSDPRFRDVLEIGPSTNGGLIKRFLGNGEKRVECVEISKFASDYLSAHGVSTFNGPITGYEPKHRFDLIIACEVIEHDPDPAAFVSSVERLLKKDGLFFLSTGNSGSLMAGRAGADWYYFDPPAHLSYFNRDNIKELLMRNGFSKVKMVTFGYAWIEKALRYRLAWLLPAIGGMNLGSGMLVFARK